MSSQEITLDKYQQSAVNSLLDATINKARKVTVLAGSAGRGKEHPVTTIVKTPTGDREIGTLSIGDEVIGRNGLPTKVTGVFPQGEKDVYEITFRDKTTALCGLNHLWTVRGGHGGNKWVTKTLKDIIEAGITRKDGSMKYKIPLCSPVQYRTKKLPIKPYLLGALLGDGCLVPNRSVISLSSHIDDTDILIKAIDELPERNMASPARYTSENGIQVNITGRKGTLKSVLASLGLRVKSREKFIPKEYFLGSIEQRLDLLHGLMDTDGSVSRNRVSFCSKSIRLVDGIIEIAQSLGMTAIKSERTNRPGEYYVNIKSNNFCPFSLERKAKGWKPSWKNPPSRYMASVEKLPKKQQQTCITVAADDSLYLINDFIVTHNSTIVSHFLSALHHEHGYSMDEVRICAPTAKAALVVAEMLRRASQELPTEPQTIHRMLGCQGPGRWLCGPDNRLALNCLIVEEASMVDSLLLARVIDSVSEDCTIILSGDNQQLLPVGPGCPFNDIINTSQAQGQVNRLVNNYRQKAGEMLACACEDVLVGRMPKFCTPDDFMVSEGRNAYRIVADDADAVLDGIKKVVKIWDSFFSADYIVVAPQHSGRCGIKAINNMIQQEINPHNSFKPEVKVFDYFLREKDQVKQTKNNYELGVFNGFIGKITKIDKATGEISVQYPGKDFPTVYTKQKDIQQLCLAYCISIHSSQGAQFGHVCVVAHSSHYYMLNRSLLYVGISRAQVELCVVGDDKGLKRAVSNDVAQARNTLLGLTPNAAITRTKNTTTVGGDNKL